MAGVILKNINKFYGTNKVLDQVNLDVNDHEFLVLVGPSGCGKSTLLRIIAGLEESSNGTVIIGDQTVTELAPKDRDIAMVFQNYALYPHMNVYDNMAFSLKMRKVARDEIDRLVREAASILEINDLLKRKPRQLSGGQRQRVALGRAIVRKAQVFLLDEPLSNLDAKLRVQMRSEIIKLHRKIQATMIYVTHDQIEAMTMGDRIVVMKDGKIQQVGTPEEIYTRPNNLFVASFIGMPPMNFITWRPGLILGVRPEHIALTEQKGGASYTESRSGIGDYVLEGTVEVTEYTGAEKLVYLQTNFGQLVVRIEHSQPIKEGKNYNLRLSANDLHLFDSKSGARLNQDLGDVNNEALVKIAVAN
ncbi:MAG: sn-glycerol-3-phosphate ABC transporter ATP-binding protein UgpC [Syntrophaceticus schinkii]|jgi:multiple sugar transport system ATP-binding protein|nr:sn-glycerol-3-phosphate ABC transporter ATP-binding protein UgpC [Syntrophaceticus schinkii]